MKIELFDELFSCYYSTIYHVLREASRKELTDTELRKLILKASDYYGFPATTSFIIGGAIDAGKNEEAMHNKDAWPFFDRIERKTLNTNGMVEKTTFVNKSRLKNISTVPLSKVEKMWLKSILSDPRIKLFMEDEAGFPDLQDVEPLFDWKDYVLFDQYTDGDPYQDEHYIEMFRKVLKAVRNHSRLQIKFQKANSSIFFEQDGAYKLVPAQRIGTVYIDSDYLEYSERDDKFRLIGNNPRFGRSLVNIASIVSCNEVEKTNTSSTDIKRLNSKDAFQKKVVFELKDDKNTLERFLLNFSHYEKETEYLKDRKLYRVSVSYDETDEKDVIIRVLSFGPYVKVIEPESFVGLITDRLEMQKNMLSTLTDG